MESNKDRQYRTDHDRCWYTVKVKLARFWHTAPAPEILTLGVGGGFQHSGNYPGPSVRACFYAVVGREILTLGEGFNTQVITLWCFYIVPPERLTGNRAARRF